MFHCRCGHEFDHALGKYGCPNCNGDSGGALSLNAICLEAGVSREAYRKRRRAGLTHEQALADCRRVARGPYKGTGPADRLVGQLLGRWPRRVQS